MKLRSIGVRLDGDEYEALRRAAATDQRGFSTLVRMIVVAWLRREGWLKDEAKKGVKR